MGSSGLIIAFVVALWAAYFVPLVLRRYDEAGKNSSLDLEGPLRRVISPRRHTVQEEESVTTHLEPSGRDRSQHSPARPPAGDSQLRRSARIAARRRRRTLLTLVGLLLVTSVVTVMLVAVPVWAPAIPAALIVAWLVACRVQVRRERGISRPRSVREVETAPQFVDEEDTIVVSHQIEDIDPDVPHVMEKSELPADALVENLEIAVPSVSDSGQALWDPLPITLPSYVTKPRAGRTVRTIDLNAANTWSSGHVEGEQTELPGMDRHDDDGYGQRAVGH